jgi:hypothetical protein
VPRPDRHSGPLTKCANRPAVSGSQRCSPGLSRRVSTRACARAASRRGHECMKTATGSEPRGSSPKGCGQAPMTLRDISINEIRRQGCLVSGLFKQTAKAELFQYLGGRFSRERFPNLPNPSIPRHRARGAAGRRTPGPSRHSDFRFSGSQRCSPGLSRRVSPRACARAASRRGHCTARHPAASSQGSISHKAFLPLPGYLTHAIPTDREIHHAC